MELQNYHQDISKLHVNCMEPRSYYIPYHSVTSATSLERSRSERFNSLCGDWFFEYFAAPFEVPEGILQKEYTENDATIPVPSCWQVQGYDKHQYTNHRYPFPFDPPYVPADNPTGVYTRTFTIDEKFETFRHYLNFEGVDSCFYLYINEQFVAYSQVSHSTSEIDITDYVKVGENKITVIVLKWCDGSYFEDQDKFRLSGIFREVYILSRPRGHISDYFVHTEIGSNYRTATISADITAPGAESVKLTLLAPDGTTLERAEADENGKASFNIDSPVFWTAETPELYSLIIECNGEYICEKVGIKSIKIENGVIRFNGKAIKLRGTNRHDSDPRVGAAVTEEMMLKDIMLMKAYNINAVRSSHYPNDPRFVEMCDKYGIYLIDEADLETHGTVDFRGGYKTEYFPYFSDDPKYKDVILDRAKRLVERDKNRASVLMWSMGNESGYGCNIVDALSWTKQRDPSRITHYESVNIHGVTTSPEPDCVSRMYPTPAWCKEYLEEPTETRPLVLCEFSHVLGNSPGDFKDYWDIIDENPRFVGAFVWEWCDHAFILGTDKNGNTMYGHGGDFGEEMHDGNFCLDGLVTPDRVPSIALYDYKQVIKPFKVEALDLAAGEFEVKNLYDFSYLSRLECKWEITDEGKVIDHGTLGALAIPPHKSENIHVDYELPENGNCYIKFTFTQLGSNAWADDGHEIGFEQFKLPVDKKYYEAEVDNTLFSISESEKYYRIVGNGFTYYFDKPHGCFEKMSINGKDLLDAPIQFNIWRAQILNDIYQSSHWEDFRLRQAKPHLRSLKLEKSAYGVKIHERIKIGAESCLMPVCIDAVWEVNTLGIIKLSCETELGEVNFIPRFGIRMTLKKPFENDEYFGFGPHESYSDKKNSCYVGRFKNKIIDEYSYDYLVPQECGYHYNSEWAAVYDDDKTGLLFRSSEPFGFSALPYSIEEMDEAEHRYELPEYTANTICVDYRQSGVGSNACGPELPDEHRVKEEKMKFEFEILPISSKTKDIATLSRTKFIIK